MNQNSLHTFHIPVMGLGFTVDTPVKVARFGINSVISIIEDNLLEELRKFYCSTNKMPYVPIFKNDDDSRAMRITAYLDMVDRMVKDQMMVLKKEVFTEGNDIVKYFLLLPHSSPARKLYDLMIKLEEGEEKESLCEILRNQITPGSIDVNIMTKCDRPAFSESGEMLPPEYSDAMAALRGYANSQLDSSIVFSAGMNPRLYSYCESFKDFFPDENGSIKKKIILKVSDFRSASIQGKFLAKKGLWVSEFRIESGLNCGGHAFATDGFLMGPILEEFKLRKNDLAVELLQICNAALLQKGVPVFLQQPGLKISAQGGIGTANENTFLLEHYQVNSTGWGSPFLLVPEATNVDEETLHQLTTAQREDFYLSNSSPLGVLFNNFSKSTGNRERMKKIEKGRPGSPCYNKYLSFNTEFTTEPICTASRVYQELKIKQLKSQCLTKEELVEQIDVVTEKECICQGLGTSVFLTNRIQPPHKFEAVSICPGPNLAYFSNIFSLQEMIDHIYGRKKILNHVDRPNMFINELNLYVDYLKQEINKSIHSAGEKKQKYLNTFRENLLAGIEYYKPLAKSMIHETETYRNRMNQMLQEVEEFLLNIQMPETVKA